MPRVPANRAPFKAGRSTASYWRFAEFRSQARLHHAAEVAAVSFSTIARSAMSQPRALAIERAARTPIGRPAKASAIGPDERCALVRSSPRSSPISATRRESAEMLNLMDSRIALSHLIYTNHLTGAERHVRCYSFATVHHVLVTVKQNRTTCSLFFYWRLTRCSPILLYLWPNLRKMPLGSDSAR